MSILRKIHCNYKISVVQYFKYILTYTHDVIFDFSIQFQYKNTMNLIKDGFILFLFPTIHETIMKYDLAQIDFS